MTQKTIGPATSLSAVTTGTGSIVPCGGQTSNLTVYLIGAGTISAGAVVLEEAYEDPTGSYGGMWSPLSGSPITVTGLSGGAQAAYHYVGCYWDVRARVSTNLTGGGVITAVIIAS